MCNLLFLCLICHAVFSRFHAAKCEENGKHQDCGDRKGHIDVLHEARDDEAHKAHGCDRDCIGQLRGHMVEMLALRTGGGHDGRVGDGGAVVAAHSACAAGGDADDEQRAVGREDSGDDRDQNADMVPYCNLPESEKLYDREMAMQTLKLVKKLGFDLVKRNDYGKGS